MKKDDEKYCEKNSALTQDETAILNRIEKAVHEDDVIQFEKKVSETFSSKRSITSILTRAAALFLTLVALSFMGYYYSTPLNKRLYNQYYEKYKHECLTDTYRDQNNLHTGTYKLYSSGNFEETVVEFSSIIEAEPTNFEVLFLLANSFIELERFEEAKENLEQILEAPINFYTDDALWYSSLLQIRNKNYDLSKKYLRSIDSSSKYFIPSKKLLKKINKHRK